MIIPISVAPTTDPTARTLIGSNDSWNKVVKELQGQGRHTNAFVTKVRQNLTRGDVRRVTLSEGEAQQIISLCGVLS